MSFTLLSSTDTRHVAVIGAGTLGRRVALIWASKGGAVVIADSNPETAQAALLWINQQLPAHVKAINGSAGNVTVAKSGTQEAVTDAWLVIECIPEIKASKIELLGNLDSWCSEDAIIATISSSFRSGDLIAKVSEKGRKRVLNTHYFMPPEMPPVELMSCGYTDASIFESLTPRLREIGMEPVIVKKESVGFIYGRIWAALKREIMMVLADGVGSPDDIDRLFRHCFKSEGAPCELMDRIGLQTVCNIEDHYIEERKNIPSYPVKYLRENYVETGKMGKASGRGLFDYSDFSDELAGIGGEQPSLRSRLLGAWELVDYSATLVSDPAVKIYPMTRDARGILIYTADGYMSAQLQIPGQPPFAVPSVAGGTDAESIQAAKRYLAYTGPFFISEDAEEEGKRKKPVLSHEMRNCSFPNWMGDTQQRLFEFEEEEGKRYLTLTMEGTALINGQHWDPRLRWKKLDDNR